MSFMKREFMVTSRPNMDTGVLEYGVQQSHIPDGTKLDDGSIIGDPQNGQGALFYLGRSDLTAHIAMNITTWLDAPMGAFGSHMLHMRLNVPIILGLIHSTDHAGNGDYSICPCPLITGAFALIRDFENGHVPGKGLLAPHCGSEAHGLIATYTIEQGNELVVDAVPAEDGQRACYYIGFVFGSADPFRAHRIPMNAHQAGFQALSTNPYFFGMDENQSGLALGIVWVFPEQPEGERFIFVPQAEIMERSRPKLDVAKLV